MGAIALAVIAVGDAPAEVKEYVVDRAVLDAEGVVIGTEPVVVKPDYMWKITVGKVAYYMAQKHNPWEYQAEDTKDLDVTPHAELAKVSMDGKARYAGDSPTSICRIPKYLFDRWNDAHLLTRAVAAVPERI